MAGQKTELEKRKIVRLSNKEANRLTKECLITALMELLESKELDRITVAELTRKAGVSRTAFYSNYDSIQDVLLLKPYSLQQVLACGKKVISSNC